VRTLAIMVLTLATGQMPLARAQPRIPDAQAAFPAKMADAPRSSTRPGNRLREFTGPDCAQAVAVGPDNIAYVVGCMTNPAGTTSAFVARANPICAIFCVNIIPNFFGLPGPDCAYGVSEILDDNASVVGCMANPAGTTSAFVARVDVN